MDLRKYNLSKGMITLTEALFADADPVNNILIPELALWQGYLSTMRAECDALYIASPGTTDPSLMKRLIDENKVSVADGVKNAYAILDPTYTISTFQSQCDDGGKFNLALDWNIALEYILQGSLDPAPPDWVNTWSPAKAAAIVAWPDYGTFRQLLGNYMTFGGFATI